MKEKALRDNKIMKVMKVNELRHFVGRTEKGELSYGIKKDQTGDDYQFYLDAVPVEKEQNDELIKMLA